MKISKTLVALTIATTVAGANVAPAFAWHPKGEITKYVTNVTAGGTMQDADSQQSAVHAKPGETLKYTIVVKNVAAPASKQHNDLSFVSITDKLPAGVTLKSGTANKDFAKTVVVPGKSVTHEFTVTVNKDAKDGQVIKNTACYEGDSVVKDNKQKGCEDAVVVVDVPKVVTPEEPVVETPEVEGEQTEVAPEEIPATGATSFMSLLGLSGLAYGATLYLRRK